MNPMWRGTAAADAVRAVIAAIKARHQTVDERGLDVPDAIAATMGIRME